MAACTILRLGIGRCSAIEAIRFVRARASERCVRTTRQAEFVARYAASLQEDPTVPVVAQNESRYLRGDC
jgi:hypothetical protein